VLGVEELWVNEFWGEEVPADDEDLGRDVTECELVSWDAVCMCVRYIPG
jgi:hypothetical protein